jgi:hypothetical protein
MPDPDLTRQELGQRLEALAERLRQAGEPSDEEAERGAASLRRLPRVFRPPMPKSP